MTAHLPNIPIPAQLRIYILYMRKKDQFFYRSSRRSSLPRPTQKLEACGKQQLLGSILKNIKREATEQNDTEEDKDNEQRLVEELEKSFEIEYMDRDPQTNSNLVGKDAVAAFYKHYKRLSRIKDQNQCENIKPSVYTSLLSKCQDLRILPSKIGILKYKGKPDEVTLSHSHYGSKYLSAFSQGIRQLNLTSCHLTSSKLTSQSASHLLPNLSKNLISIHLANNQLGLKGVSSFHKLLKNGQKLTELDLSNNNLTDTGVINLCSTLSNCQRIRRINLSRNSITCRSAPSLATLISNGGFNEVYLQWNKIQSRGGREILEALALCQTVKVFDMSWNMIGNCRETSAVLCGIIKGNGELVHVDFSGNYFTREECGDVAEALKSNQSLYGFHFKGNFGYVDAQGFLVIDESMRARDYREVSLHQKIDSCHLRQLTRKETSETPARDVCWICQGWIEQEFIFQAEDDESEKDIWVHFSFEGYNGRYLGRTTEKQLKFSQMIPPRKIQFFFTCNDQQVASTAHERVILYDNNMLREIQLGEQRIDCFVEERNVIGGELGGIGGGGGAMGAAATATTIGVTTGTKIGITMGRVVDQGYRLLVKQKPREQQKHREEQDRLEGNARRNRNREVTEQTEEEIRAVFDSDWAQMTVHSLMPMDQICLIKDILCKNHPLIRSLFRYYSCLNSTDNNGFYMDSPSLFQFCTDCQLLTNTLTHQQVQTSLRQLIDLTKKRWQDSDTLVPATGISCYRFMELLVKLAKIKFREYEQGKGVELLLLSIRNREFQGYERWRGEVFAVEDGCEAEFRVCRARLEQVFFGNCSRRWRLGERKFMYFQDFRDVFNQHKTDELYNLTQQKLRLAFFYSKRGPIDYYSSDTHRRLYFPEFLQALALSSHLSTCQQYRDNHLLTLRDKLANTIKSLTSCS